MQPQLVIQGVSIVLRGHFNPAIFQPAWFAAQGLIRYQEAEAAEISIVHPKAAVFQAEWLQIHVVEDKFQATTIQEAYYEAIRDLVIGVFNLLNHTPLRVMGINRDFQYRLESEKVWHGVGHRLAPKRDWEDLLENPGMRSLVMEGERPDNLDGYIRVKIEPSTRIEVEFGGYGIYVEVNDHYQLLSASEAPASTGEAINILSQQWAESMRRSSEIAQRIAGLGELK